MWTERLGSQKLNNRGHYGLSDIGDGTLAYTCFYSTYCGSHSRDILFSGSGSPYDLKSATSSSSVTTGATTTLSRSITEIDLEAGVGWIPDNTSIEYEVSVDGGTTWKKYMT